jgi:hypothetical protein
LRFYAPKRQIPHARPRRLRIQHQKRFARPTPRPEPAVAAKIEKAEPVTAAGVPKHYPDAKKLVTEDCIQPIRSEAQNTR